jgi:sugar phosphate isomerase/epimerase
MPRIAASTGVLPSRTHERGSPADWETDVTSLVRAGFGALDLFDSWLEPANLSASELRDLRSVLDASGIDPVGLSLGRRSIIDPHTGEENLQYVRRSLEAAAALGIPIVNIGLSRPLTDEQKRWSFWVAPSPRDDLASYDIARNRITVVCEEAQAAGLLISLELYEYTLLGLGARAAQLVRDVAQPNLGVNPDLANLYRIPERLSETWQETLQAVLPYMNYWHVKNYRRIEHYPSGPYYAWPTSLGSGDIDYRLAIQMAADVGYAGPLCIEHYGGDALWKLQLGLIYLTRVLGDIRCRPSSQLPSPQR